MERKTAALKVLAAIRDVWSVDDDGERFRKLNA
jgi:hypothetical protein